MPDGEDASIAAKSRESRRRRVIVVLGAVLSIVLLAFVVLAATVDRWLMKAMDPGAFDPASVPAVPDYSLPGSWAALPETVDGADVALPELAAIDQSSARADVFYVHPTTWLGDGWNGPIDDPTVVRATHRGGTLIQASVFNACCAVHAPRYRQAHGLAYTNPDGRGDQAREVAYSDVSAAFDEFLRRTGDRPFIIAGHSQGAVMAARLLRERVAGSRLRRRLVAAYLPGVPVRAEELGEGIELCASPTQVGCAAVWNARGPEYRPNGLEFDAEDPDTMVGRACVNPITWSTDGQHAPASQNQGALFFDTPAPQVKPAFADAQCVEGVLIVTELGDPERDFMSTLLLWMMGPGNYHPIEYQLYYLDLRANAVARVDAHFAAEPK